MSEGFSNDRGPALQKPEDCRLSFVFQPVFTYFTLKKQPMSTNHTLAYLLLYAANIDTEVSSSEMTAIREKLGSEEEWQQVREEFEKDSEYTRLQKISDLLKERSSPEDRELLLKEVKNLMQADEDFSVMERYLLKLMGRY